MAEIVDVPLADLLLDPGNARLSEIADSQHDVALDLARQQGDKLIRLARDIVDHGVDPTALVAIVPTEDQHKRYFVVEGNRRVLALKSLETPSLIAPVLSPTATKTLTALAGKFAAAPIGNVKCALFETAKDADHWVEVRHTGENLGVGLVSWGAAEKDRFTGRRAQRSPAGQVLDFVQKHGTLSAEALNSSKGIITSLKRLLSTPQVREKLGIDIVENTVISNHPTDEVAKGLSRIVEDLSTGRKKVTDIYHVGDRINYINSIPKTLLPRKSKKLDEPATLASLASGKPATKPPPRKPPRKKQRVRTTVIPRECQLDVDPPRINAIYMELSTMNLEQFPNACSVLLRVFMELSVDHYLSENKVLTDEKIRNTPLAKRLKSAASHLNGLGKISAKLREAIDKVADSKHVLSASTPTLNQYVHNEYVFPKGNDLRAAWDEIQPFAERLWAK